MMSCRKWRVPADDLNFSFSFPALFLIALVRLTSPLCFSNPLSREVQIGVDKSVSARTREKERLLNNIV